jgi:quinol monooxygenase YgiN
VFGTVGRFKVKPGKLDDVIALMKSDTREVDGSIAYYIYKLEEKPDEGIIAVVFRDKKSYFANADDPAQDAWYRKLVALLEAPPTWEDGEIVHSGK